MFFHGTLSSKNPYGAISNTYFKARAVKTTRRIFLDPAQNHRIYSFPDEALNRCSDLCLATIEVHKSAARPAIPGCGSVGWAVVTALLIAIPARFTGVSG